MGMIDTPTLMIAIAFSSGALMLTLLVSWLNARRDTFLLSWAAGLGFVAVALAFMDMRYGQYNALHQTIPFAALIIGMGLLHLGTYQFRTGRCPKLAITALLAAFLISSLVPFFLGMSALGTIMLNLACTTYMALAGYQYWAGRHEAPTPLKAGAFLFFLTGASFLACAVMIALSGQWVIETAPQNWAEDFNAIMAIVGLTGIGALSLTLGQSRASQRHRMEAQTDSLTGLLNRRALFDRFGATDLPPGTPVLMFDIDHFKQINDRKGHAAGDAVIRNFAGILQERLVPDVAIARLGGEEFSAILAPMPVDAAKVIAESVRAAFAAAGTLLGSDSISSTVSVGVATSGEGESFSSTLNRADAALYKAKDGGRNRVTTAPLRLIA
jgi:diguanylate cyclase (GGDEF)-like protein